jgi:eukaryotic-like serine/threonine-protein kinase
MALAGNEGGIKIMNPDRMQEIERLYDKVLEREPSQRKSFLEQKCAGDESLRQAVELLLDRKTEVEGFLKAPAMDVAARALAQDQSHDPQPDLVGRSLLHYHVKEKIGEGGMGEVYRARDSHLNRDVAIKVLPDIFSGDRERLARFDREAKLLASLNHPNIAGIYGFEEAENRRFLVMELVEGKTLAARIARGPIPVDEALEVCRQIAEGLEAAHEKGVIHRDLKPANVKITPEGKVKILDFGLAKAFQGEIAAADASHSPTLTDQMTRPGVILGTAAYMAPEQAKGKAVDKRADIWAFGCILYECLTGKRPFEGETVTESIAAILMREPDWQVLPENTPPIVRRLLRRCLEKDRKRRFESAADARLEIEETRESPVELTGVPSSTHISRRMALLLSVGALVLGAAIAAVGFWVLKPSPPQPSAQSPAHVEINLPPGVQLVNGNCPPLALSPDGGRLVYMGTRGGLQQLFIRPLDSQEAKPLPGTEGAESPFFSPDGEWIGFFAGGKLKKVSVAGGTALPLCDSGGVGGATWGSDNTIVFSSSAASGLLRVSAAGGKPDILTNADRTKGECSHRWPEFLPGGKALLFTVMTGPGWDEYQIEALRLDTGEKRIVLRGGHTGRFVPTGHLVYYRAGTLLAVRFDPVRLEVIGSVPKTVTEGVRESTTITGAEYSLSATGSLAYVPTIRQFDRRLLWVDRKGTIQPLPAPLRNYWSTSISPDGRRAAIVIMSGTYDIWIYDMERGTLSRFTTEGGSNQTPLWTPDGKHLTYQGYRAGLRNIFRKTADGTGDEERLTTGENSQSPASWTPDGKWLAYYDASPTTSNDIWMLRLDGERKREPFLRTPFNESSARFSPDGRWLAYQSNESGRFEIYLQPFPGPGGKWPISTEGGTTPRWAHNGNELFYRNGNKMMAVDIKTEPTFTAGKPRLLFEGQFEASYDVSQDGQRFFMIQFVELERPATQINLALNWLEELKRLVPTGKK